MAVDWFCYSVHHIYGRSLLIFRHKQGVFILSRTQPSVSLIVASASSTWLDRYATEFSSTSRNSSLVVGVEVATTSTGGRYAHCLSIISLSAYALRRRHFPTVSLPYRASLGPRHCSLLSTVLVWFDLAELILVEDGGKRFDGCFEMLGFLSFLVPQIAVIVLLSIGILDR